MWKETWCASCWRENGPSRRSGRRASEEEYSSSLARRANHGLTVLNAFQCFLRVLTHFRVGILIGQLSEIIRCIRRRRPDIEQRQHGRVAHLRVSVLERRNDSSHGIAIGRRRFSERFHGFLPRCGVWLLGFVEPVREWLVMYRERRLRATADHQHCHDRNEPSHVSCLALRKRIVTAHAPGEPWQHCNRK